jgi:ABC-type transport system involved in cytochrome bd biosynthesis fused ATPase/permease subunit
MSPPMGIQTVTQAEPVDVSYTLFAVERRNSLEGLLQKIATTINVQLTFENQPLPFVPFNGFDEIKHHDKVFLYGPSGCGKSRGIVEIIKDQLEGFDNVYIIKSKKPS